MNDLEREAYSDRDRENSFNSIRRGLGDMLRPKPRLNVWQWAEANRYLAKGVSAKSIEGPERYTTAVAPHQRKPQESATDLCVQVTVLVMASQIGGKTEIFNNVLGYHMDHCPRSCVVMYPQLDAAEKYSKKKFTPMVEASPCLARIIKPNRTRDSGNTILAKEFRGGSVYFVGANSPPSLRGTSGAVLLGDEIDAMKGNAEGDPVDLLWKRGESHPNCVKMLSSTPTIKGASLIWDWFEASDQEYWFVPCPKCGKWQTLKWSQVVWPKGPLGEHLTERAELVCAHCAAALSDKDRLAMYYAGEWRATAEFKGIQGFHLNGLNCPWPAQKGFRNRLHQAAEEFVRAHRKGDLSSQVWVNTFLCEPWEEETEQIQSQALNERTEGYTPAKVPAGVVIVLAVVDVQKDRLECETIGLGFDDETWGIEYRKLFGDTEQDQVWEDLAEHLGKKYSREDGVELPISATAIDMRYHTGRVVQFAKTGGVPRCYVVHGKGSGTLLVTSSRSKRYKISVHAVNTKLAKDTIFARLRKTAPGPRFMHFPGINKETGYPLDYFDQLTAEVLRKRREKGVMIETYEKIRERNEALDIRVYFLACIDILKPNLTAIAKKLVPTDVQEKKLEGGQEQKMEPTQPVVKPTPIAKAARPPRAGFVSRWKK